MVHIISTPTRINNYFRVRNNKIFTVITENINIKIIKWLMNLFNIGFYQDIQS